MQTETKRVLARRHRHPNGIVERIDYAIQDEDGGGSGTCRPEDWPTKAEQFRAAGYRVELTWDVRARTRHCGCSTTLARGSLVL